MPADLETTRRALLTGTAAIGGVDLLPYARPARAAMPDHGLRDLKVRYDQTLAAAREALAAHSPFEDAFASRNGFALPEDERASLKAAIGLDDAEAAATAAENANSSVISEIIETPATSLVGMRIKAQVSHSESNLCPELIESLIDDLLRTEA